MAETAVWSKANEKYFCSHCQNFALIDEDCINGYGEVVEEVLSPYCPWCGAQMVNANVMRSRVIFEDE